VIFHYSVFVNKEGEVYIRLEDVLNGLALEPNLEMAIKDFQQIKKNNSKGKA